MHSHTTTRPVPDRMPTRWATVPRRWVGLVVAAVVLLVVTAWMTALPPVVDHVSIGNSTGYSLDLEVAGGGRDHWLSLGVVEKGSTVDMGRVLDQGDTWVFRLRGQGQAGGEVRVTRADLAANHWHLEIPADVAQRLAATGAPLTP